MKKESSKQTINYIVYNEMYERKPTKSELTRLLILQSAMKSYIQHGVENSTYDKIARIAKVSRPLVVHYFPQPQDIFQAVVKLIRVNFQKYVVDQVHAETNPKKKFETYVKTTLSWVEEFPEHSKIWVFFFFECARNTALREIHTEMVRTGAERILALLGKSGKENYAKARQVQMLITGAMMAMGTENKSEVPKNLSQRIYDSCLILVR